MQFPEALAFFRGKVCVAESFSESFPLRGRFTKRIRPGDEADSLAVRATIEGESILALVQVDQVTIAKSAAGKRLDSTHTAHVRLHHLPPPPHRGRGGRRRGKPPQQH